MDFEYKIKSYMSDEITPISADLFLERLHSRREREFIQRHRLISGFSAALVVLMVGFLFVSQLGQRTGPFFEDNLITAQYEIDPEVETYIEDLVLLLVDESEDVWATLAFLDEMEFEPFNQWMEVKQ